MGGRCDRHATPAVNGFAGDARNVCGKAFGGLRSFCLAPIPLGVAMTVSAMTSRLLLLTCACAVLGCGADPATRPARWPYIHAAIIAPSCATSSCHSTLARAGGFSLQQPVQALSWLRAEQFVLPGDASSPLMYLLEGQERNRMPPDGPLPQADVELIRTWIIQGASPE